MKSVIIESHGSPSVIKIIDTEEPSCSVDKVKVQIKSSSINHLDLWVRKGVPGLHIDFPRVLGSDASGVVVDVGEKVSGFNLGDKVVIQPGVYDKTCPIVKKGNENLSPTYGILGETHNGVQSEYLILDPVNLHPMPARLSFNEASSMGLVFMTAYQMLIKKAQIQKGDCVLVYGATSGVGGAAIQIAKEKGCKVISTVGDKSKVEYAESVGADTVFIHDDSLYSKVRDFLGKDRVDVVFEHVGKATWETSIRLLSKGGRLVTCGATTGSKVNVNLTHLFFKNLSILGSTMASVDTFREVFKKIDGGSYKSQIDRVYSFKEIIEAHHRVENRKNLGKVVIDFT